MSEPQVVRALRALEAARNSEGDTLNFSILFRSLPRNPEDEISKLRSQLSSATRSVVSPFYSLDHFAGALKKRLETPRKNDKLRLATQISP
jgi:hypothetical protein